MKNSLFVVSLFVLIGVAAAYMSTSEAESQMSPSQGVTASATGVVRVDPWVCFSHQNPAMAATPAPTTAKACPVRVEFGEEIADTVLLCRSIPTGQVCKTIKEVFGKK